MLTPQQIQAAREKIGTNNPVEQPTGASLLSKLRGEAPQPNYIQRVAQDYNRAGSRIIEGVKQGAEGIQQGDKVAGIESGLRTVGSIAGATFAPILEAPGIKQGIEAVGKTVMKSPLAQQLATKGVELSQKYPNASKDIEDLINIATLGIGSTVEKPIQGAVTSTAKGIASSTKKITSGISEGVSNLVPKSEEIMNRVARLTPKEANNFTKLSGGISHGEYLTKTGNFGTPDQIIKKEAEKFTQSINDVDTELAKLPGLYKNGGVDDMLSGLIEKAKNTSGDNIKSPYLQQVLDLQAKNAVDGLTMEEINAVKRLYERNVKLGYNKLVNGDKVEQATNIDNAVREWQVQQAERLGFTNLPELNKQTQLSKFIVNKLGDQVVGKTGLNNIGLTDWIMLSGGEPTAVGGFLTKKFFSSKGVQSRIAKMLSKTEPVVQVGAKVEPTVEKTLRGQFPKGVPLQLEAGKTGLPKSQINVPIELRGASSIEKGFTPSKLQQQPQSKIKSEKALVKSSTTSPKMSSLEKQWLTGDELDMTTQELKAKAKQLETEANKNKENFRLFQEKNGEASRIYRYLELKNKTK